MLHPGDTWNESIVFPDTATGRLTRRITRNGLYNEAPTYHLNAAISPDSSYAIFATAREGGSALCRADLATGTITVLATADGIGTMPVNTLAGEPAPYVAGSRGGGFTGNHACLSPSGWACTVIGGTVLAIHTQTLQSKTLVEIAPKLRWGNPIATADGKSFIIPQSNNHPDLVAGKRTERHYYDAVTADLGGMKSQYIKIDIADGEWHNIWSEKQAGGNHVQPCPADPAIWLIDRDFPPKYPHGSDGGKTTRAWLLDTRDFSLTELRPRFEHRFQIHTNWSHDGQYIYYHGRSFSDTTHYIGVADRSGNVVWEQTYPHFWYGHVSSHTAAHAIITDGLVSPDLITAIHFRDQDRAGRPRIEILARHNTILDGLRGQYSHVHPHLSPNAQRLLYNRAELGRSDLLVVEM